MNKKQIIREKINEYVDNFTVHGLTRVFNASRFESLFWMMMLASGVCFSIIIIQGLVRKYLKFEVYTEIHSRIAERNYFPSLTICEHYGFLSNYFSYCGYPLASILNSKSTNCEYEIKHPDAIEYKQRNYWFNGVFNVTKCRTWGGKNCLERSYFKSLTFFNNTCMTWNPAGTIFDMYGHADIEFQYQFSASQTKDDIKMEIMLHDPQIQEIDVTKTIEIDPFQKYQIKFDKTIVKRLKSPFPSRCSDGKGRDIFPGAYSRKSCIESHSYIECYKICGAAFDYVERHIPQVIKDEYSHKTTNKSLGEIASCLFLNLKDEAKKTSHSCTFACESLDLSTISTFSTYSKPRLLAKRKNNRTLVYNIGLQHQSVDSYKVMEEKEVYSWDQMACEMGGFIGLVIGASFISLIEIIASIILRLVHKIL